MDQGRKISVVIPAAGSGKRMKSGRNKVYLKLLGKTVLERTVEAFERNPRVDRIIVVVGREEVDYCKRQILKPEEHPRLTDIIPGGAERCHSVYEALKLLDETDIVLVHDGARPLVDDEIIDRCIEGVQKWGCCAAGVPVKDTIKIVKEGYVAATPERSSLFAMHTPQAFFAGFLRDAVRQGIEAGFFGTDEAVFAEKVGKKVFIVESKYDNIKLTTSDDLTIAEAILMKREEQE